MNMSAFTTGISCAALIEIIKIKESYKSGTNQRLSLIKMVFFAVMAGELRIIDFNSGGKRMLPSSAYLSSSFNNRDDKKTKGGKKPKNTHKK
jgi:hypothetical protein